MVLLALVLYALVIAAEFQVIGIAWLDFVLALLQAMAFAWLLLFAWTARRQELRSYVGPRATHSRHPHAPAPPARGGRPGSGFAVLAGLVGLIGFGIYLVRPLTIIHAPLWLIVKYPLIWLVTFVFASAVAAVVRWRSWYRHWSGLVAWTVGAGVVALVPTALIAPKLSAAATYHHYEYVQISRLPSGGEVRILPREVGAKMASIGYNLSGHTLGDAHLILDAQNHRLTWSFEQAPSGFRNVYFRYAEGIALLDAQETNRSYREIDRRFRVAPGMQVSDNTDWRIYKHDYFSVPTSAVAVVTPGGEPEFVVPTLSYKGWLVKYPVVSAVYVFRRDGSSERLSVAEARKRPDVAGSGQVIPQGLARELQDAYAYKHGIWNASVGHNDQTQIVDSGDTTNHQPYLMAFSRTADDKALRPGERERLYWVSSAEPKGKAFATKAIFLTDAITGVTYVRSFSRDTSLTGANQAVQDAKSLAIPGIVFAASYEQGAAAGGGRYQAVEPRPVFVKHRLQYLLSIIPTSHNDVTKSVIVDAASNKVVALFNHDTDPDADRKLVNYLRTGVLAQSAAAAPGQVGQPGTTTNGSQTATTRTVTTSVTQLLEENERLLREVRANQLEIQKLLKKNGR
jgi:hypothetical protein